MRTVVLVHGAWHGAWCWSSVLAGLDERGIPAVAIELPLADLGSDAQHVGEALAGIDGPVVLVGHSYGGAVITAAGSHPSVAHLVYVCAFAPDTGETVLELAVGGVGGQGVGAEAELGAVMVFSDDQTSSTLDPALVGSAIYHDCGPVDVERAIGSLRPQGSATFASPLEGPPAWRSRPATYLLCGEDRAIPPPLQRQMAGRIPDAAIVEWPTSSHSPFLSRPAEVVDVLAALSVSSA